MARSSAQLDSVDGLAQLSFLVHGLLERRAAEQQLSMAATRLLGVLRDRTPSLNELAALLGLDKSSTSGLVGRAERRGLVARTTSPADGRAVQVTLTAAGQALAATVTAEFSADVAAVLAHLSAADRRTLDRLVNRVVVAHAATAGVDLFADIEQR